MIFLLFNSALRSFLLGLLAWAVLKSLRIRDSDTETITWTTLLVICLSMPLLNHYLTSLTLAISYAPGQPLAPHRLTEIRHGSQRILAALRHDQVYLLGAYMPGFIFYMTRMIIGFSQSLRLYLRAVHINQRFPGNYTVRMSADLSSPVSLANVILVPADYCGWSDTKREAVLAHEGAHIARGDYFVQLAASLHCAIFWFSPFAWWLRSKLAEIAETASDEAAVEQLGDEITYAEILLDVAYRRQQFAATVPMAKGSSIQQRIERILSESPSNRSSTPVRVVLFCIFPIVVLLAATATTALVPAHTVSAPIRTSSPTPIETVLATTPSVRNTKPRDTRLKFNPAVARAHKDRNNGPPNESPDGTRTAYNPKALLEFRSDPIQSSLPSTFIHRGHTFYIFSTGTPIAETAVVAGIYRMHSGL